MSVYPSVRIEGGILGPDLPDEIVSGDVEGQKAQDFGFPQGRSLTDEIAARFAEARVLREAFLARLEKASASESITSLTREAWVIPLMRLLGYDLRFNQQAYEVDGTRYPVSHRAGEDPESPPVHIAAFDQDLGRVPPSGRPRMSPHALVQEYLNRSESLWGIVTNGRVVRLLRDSMNIRRQAFVEFDLDRMLGDEARFQDFALMFRLLHRSRLPERAADSPSCLLEVYHQRSLEQGGRVRDRLRDGVEKCLVQLAEGFLSHSSNEALRNDIRNGRLTPADLYRQLLRLVYRFLFLLVSEDRGLISDDPVYLEHYGVSRLRRMTDRRSSYTDDHDIWLSLRALRLAFTDEQLAGVLRTAPLNGELFSEMDLDGCRLSNRSLLCAFRNLAYYEDTETKVERRVNYAALDVEELGSIYESLLDYRPSIDLSETRPRFGLAPGSERKSTGSYYTPPELVAELIRSALEPVLEERLGMARRVARSEWRAVSEEMSRDVEVRNLVHSVLSGSGSLAEEHGTRGAGIPTDRRIPAGGAVRYDVADPQSGRLDTRQHSGGVGPGEHGGVPAVHQGGEGQPAGAGDSHSAQHPGQPVPRTGSGSVAGGGADPWPSASDAPAQPSEEADLNTPVTARRSPPSARWDALSREERERILMERAILSIRVCDPACGSGHFLLAAARRLGKELAAVRTGEQEPGPDDLRRAVRDVIAHCIYAVDKNPLAVELCRVALWLEAHCKGFPLTFLDHRIKCGDSLLGVFDLSVLSEPLPEKAFEPRTDDDRVFAKLLKERNRKESRDGSQKAFSFQAEDGLLEMGLATLEVDAIPDDTPENIRRKKQLYEQAQADPELARRRLACDLWTAAFFQPLVPQDGASTGEAAGITTAVVRQAAAGEQVNPRLAAVAQALAAENRFFHWPLEFPEVFADGGFDAALGNPPWEQIQLAEQEFFAERDPRIAKAEGEERKEMIRRLPEDNPDLHAEFRRAARGLECSRVFYTGSGRFDLTARGKINLYALFAELFKDVTAERGRAGLVCPTGIATDDSTKAFFGHLTKTGRLAGLLDFENRQGLFPEVHRSYKFCLLTIAGRRTHSADFAFFLTNTAQLRDSRRRFRLEPEDILLLNPNTRTCPVFRTRQDADLTRAIYRRVPVLVREGQTGSEGEREPGSEEENGLRFPDSPAPGLPSSNPWGVRFRQGLFNMTSDSSLFRTREQLEAEGWTLKGNIFHRDDERYLPLYEAKMIWHFDHRFGTYEGVQDRSSTHLPTPTEAQYRDPCFTALPWYWVPEDEVEERLVKRDKDGFVLWQWDRPWLLGFRDVTNATNERTAIFTVLPRTAVGHTSPLMFGARGAAASCLLLANLGALTLDFAARQKVGGTHLTYNYLQQFPVLPPARYSPLATRFIVPRVLELTYTAWDLKGFAEDIWNEADDTLRAEILQRWGENREGEIGKGEIGKREVGSREVGSEQVSTPSCPHSPTPSLPAPFLWHEERRAVIRAELDAFYAALYGLNRKQLRYILDPHGLSEKELEDILDPWEDPTCSGPHLLPEKPAVDFPGETFRVLKEKEERQFGEYRTRRLVLEAWERIMASGQIGSEGGRE